MLDALPSIVGTTARVRNSEGIPSEKSRRGSGWGATSSVASQFTRATASWLTPRTERNPSRAIAHPGKAPTWSLASKPPAKSAVSSVIAPR
ncbi:MAG: hypothetical protein WA133_04215 [Syntrophales bacterium]